MHFQYAFRGSEQVSIFSDEDKRLIEWLIKNGHSRIFAEYVVTAWDKQFKNARH